MRRDPRSAASRITYLELGVVYDLGLLGGDPDRAVERRRRRLPHLSRTALGGRKSLVGFFYSRTVISLKWHWWVIFDNFRGNKKTDEQEALFSLLLGIDIYEVSIVLGIVLRSLFILNNIYS
jgi:hypothetical protein